MDEDKQKICDLLVPVVQATRGGSDVTALEYMTATLPPLSLRLWTIPLRRCGRKIHNSECVMRNKLITYYELRIPH